MSLTFEAAEALLAFGYSVVIVCGCLAACVGLVCYAVERQGDDLGFACCVIGIIAGITAALFAIIAAINGYAFLLACLRASYGEVGS